jgi:hypothetical protein
MACTDPHSLLARLNQRVKQKQISFFSRREIVAYAFRDVADRAGLQSDASAVDPQAATASEHVADYVFVAVTDLLRVRMLFWFEGDDPGTELFPLDAALVADFRVNLAKILNGLSDVDDFHLLRR